MNSAPHNGNDMNIRALRPGVILYNGGTRCDTAIGPCACGAWHTAEENRPTFPDAVLQMPGQAPSTLSEDAQELWFEGSDMHAIINDGRHIVYKNFQMTYPPLPPALGLDSTSADGVITIPITMTFEGEELPEPPKTSRFDIALGKK